MEALAKEVERCEVHYWHMGDGQCSCSHDCDNCGVTYVGLHSEVDCITVLKNRLKLNDLAVRIEALSVGREPMSREKLMAAAKADILANLPAPFSIPDPCEGGEPCWFNQEIGYREYCPKHEAIIADKAMG